jgi:hypothetical protein
MTSLRDRTGCTSNSLHQQARALCTCIVSRGAITPVSDAGSSGNIFCQHRRGMILSTYSDSRFNEIFAHNEIRPGTFAPSRPGRLPHGDGGTRRRGYSKSVVIHHRRSGIGAPIYDYTGECIAALSLVAVVGTITVDVEEYASVLLRCGCAIFGTSGVRRLADPPTRERMSAMYPDLQGKSAFITGAGIGHGPSVSASQGAGGKRHGIMLADLPGRQHRGACAR